MGGFDQCSGKRRRSETASGSLWIWVRLYTHTHTHTHSHTHMHSHTQIDVHTRTCISHTHYTHVPSPLVCVIAVPSVCGHSLQQDGACNGLLQAYITPPPPPALPLLSSWLERRPACWRLHQSCVTNYFMPSFELSVEIQLPASLCSLQARGTAMWGRLRG